MLLSDAPIDLPIVPPNTVANDNIAIAAHASKGAGEPQRQRGGGPKTVEGKNASRLNSTQHSLRAETVLSEELEALRVTRNAEFETEFAPTTPYERWLVAKLAFISVKLDQCDTWGIKDMRRAVHRAVTSWDNDRRREIDKLGNRLSKDPERVALGLLRTTQGADWLIERWEGLGRALETKGCWDEDQRSLAFDLLGVPRILRDGFYTVPEANDRARLEILVKSKIDAIREEQEIALDGLDAHERELAACGMPLSEDAETKRLRKYETDIRRAWRTTHTELLRVRAEREKGGFRSQIEVKPTPTPMLKSSPFTFPMETNAEPPPRDCVPRAGVDYVIDRAEKNVDVMLKDMIARIHMSKSADRTEAAAKPVEHKPAETRSRSNPERPTGNRHQRRAAELRARREARKHADQPPTPGR